MNLGEMRQMVRETARDQSGQFIQDWEIDGWVNEGYYDIAARLRTYRKEVTELTAGAAQITSGSLAYPTDVVEVLSLRLADGDDVEFVSDDVFNSWADAADDSMSHTLARVFNDIFEFWPEPSDSAGYTLRYAAYPAALETADATPYLPKDMHIRLVNYARAQALLKDHNPYFENYLMMFERNLPEPPTGVVKTRPGPLTFGPDYGPFDLDPEAKHR